MTIWCKNNLTFFILGAMLLFLCIDSVCAAPTAGGGLPFDSAFQKLQASITGPFAFAVAVIGLVGAGAGLIFGGDINGFLRVFIFIVLVLSIIVTADNTIVLITGKGAELASFLFTEEVRI